MERVLGIDLGTVTIGLAYSDSLGIPHAIETFRFKPKRYEDALKRVLDILEDKDINEIAIGLPLRLNGTTSDMAEDVKVFVNMLKEAKTELKIEFVDERLSTKEAHRTINTLGLSHDKRKAVVDQISASEILDTYLRKKAYENGKDGR